MERSRADIDQQILIICEEIENNLNSAEILSECNESTPYYNRFGILKAKVETERRLVEEISLPCRFILEHFSLFLGKWDYTVGFKFGKVQTGRGLLSDLRVAEWGNVHLIIGNTEINWRDVDYQYMFYPDKVIVRPKDISKADIYLYFSYAFKYSSCLKQFQDVQNHEQTLYWHEDLIK